MASISIPTPNVSPAAGHVNDIYGQLLALLSNSVGTEGQTDAEDMLEMRFVLQKFIHELMELTKAGCAEKDEYIEAAHTAGSSQTSASGKESMGSRTVTVLVEILENAAWGFEDNTPVEQQSTNVSIKGIKVGVHTTINALAESLKQDGLDGLQHGDLEPVQQALKTPRNSSWTGSAISTTGAGKGNHGHGKARLWTDDERLEGLRLVRDKPGTHEQLADEHNRRWWQGEEVRTREGWRQEMKKLKDAGVTIEVLEAALGA